MPALGGSLAEFARAGQLDRLLEYYVPAWLERFPAVRFFSFEPERIEEHTDDAELRRLVEIVVPASPVARRVRALQLGLGHERAQVRACALVRVLQAPGGVVPVLAQAPYVCTYGYSYPRLAHVPFGRLLASGVGPAKRAAMRVALRVVLRGARATIVTSRSGEAEARSLHARRVELIPNGVDLDRFAPTPTPTAKEYDAVFVGRLSAEKDVSLLLDAAGHIPGIRLALVGDGPLRDEVAARAAATGVDVALLGTVPNPRLPEILVRARCFVLPSPYEGQPKALLEAMACGLPCVAADIPGVIELARDDTFILFASGRREALTAALRRVLDDEDLARALGREARRVVEERFDLRRLLQRETALLASVARAE